MARFLLLSSFVLAACGGDYEVIVRAPSGDVLTQGVGWELAIVQGGCEDDADSGQPPSAERLVRSLSWRAGEGGPEVGDLDEGRYGFYVRVRDADCTVRWAGCAEVNAEAGGSGRVTIELAAVEGPGCDDGLACTGEETCDETGACVPEAGTTPDCEDDDPCTVDSCEEPGGCRHDPGDLDADGDGSTCGRDCDDGNAEVSPSATEECNGIDDDCDGDADEGDVCGGIDDQCIEQTVVDTTFLACLREVSWLEAREVCTRHDAAMSVLYLDADMINAVQQYAAILPPEWWTGVNDRTQEGRWDDPGGTPLGYTQWASGEPDGGESADCVYFSVPDLGWADSDCTELRPVICER